MSRRSSLLLVLLFVCRLASAAETSTPTVVSSTPAALTPAVVSPAVVAPSAVVVSPASAVAPAPVASAAVAPAVVAPAPADVAPVASPAAVAVPVVVPPPAPAVAPATASTPASALAPSLASTPTSTPTPAPADPWLAALGPLLIEHYQPTGELILAWARPRPATAPARATLVLGNCPAELAGQLLLNVRATDAAGRVTEHTLVLRVELWRDGWTLREPAAIGDSVRVEQLDLRRYDALRERDTLAADPALDLNFARNVPAGRLLTWRDVVRRPLVRRGQPVEVSATDGPLTVTLRALAMQDAARGESVRVRNPETNKEFTAIVTSEARATVRF